MHHELTRVATPQRQHRWRYQVLHSINPSRLRCRTDLSSNRSSWTSFSQDHDFTKESIDDYRIQTRSEEQGQSDQGVPLDTVLP